MTDSTDLDPDTDGVRKDDDLAYLSPIEEIIEDARNGRMFILVDAEDRENEGDLVIPAQMATPEAINFMAMHGRGLICLTLTEDRARALNLELMSSNNRTRHQTAFTVSIEAREGVSTGISAHDRARTISVAIDPSRGPQDIVTPGHVFPLMAREGGVLVRTGHTEAAVDIARLAGLNPSGVICEIMNDDGTMARLPDLVKFAQRHGLKIGTIEDLIRYRRRHDHFLEREIETDLVTEEAGAWKMIVYVNRIEYAEHVALVKGDITSGPPPLVRVHRVDVLDDLLGAKGGRFGQLGAAMKAIEAEGRGVVVLIRDVRSTAVTDRFRAREKDAPSAGDEMLREYGVGAQILNDLGISEMVLLSNHARKIIGLDGYGLKVTGHRTLGGTS